MPKYLWRRKYNTEIRRKITIAKTALRKRKISLKTKKRVLDFYVISHLGNSLSCRFSDMVVNAGHSHYKWRDIDTCSSRRLCIDVSFPLVFRHAFWALLSSNASPVPSFSTMPSCSDYTPFSNRNVSPCSDIYTVCRMAVFWRSFLTGNECWTSSS